MAKNAAKVLGWVIPVLIVLTSCGERGAENERADYLSEEDRVTYVEPSELQTGSPVVSQLSESQLGQIEQIHEALKEVDGSSLEQKKADFPKDQNPQNEIDIWLEIVKAYQAFEEQVPEASLAQKNEAYTLLLLRSMMPSEEALKQQPPTALSEGQAKAVLGGFTLEAAPVTVVKTD